MVLPAPTYDLIAMDPIHDTPIEMYSLTGWWYDDTLPKTMKQFSRT